MKTYIYLVPLVLLCSLLTGCDRSNADLKHQHHHFKMQHDQIHLSDFTRENIEANRNEYPWFDTTYQFYRPDMSAVTELKSRLSHYSFMVFGGSWCGDTKRLLPKFYKVTDAIGVPGNKITLVGVDRNKNAVDKSPHQYHIDRIPVFIMFYDGREAGRITEACKHSVEKDMAEIYQNYLRGS